MNSITIKTPDGMNIRCDSLDDARTFVAGFFAALYCFGVYRNGEQVIGCMERPIKEYKAEMLKQLEAAEAEINQAGKE